MQSRESRSQSGKQDHDIAMMSSLAREQTRDGARVLSAVHTWAEIAISGGRDCNLGTRISAPVRRRASYANTYGGALMRLSAPHRGLRSQSQISEMAISDAVAGACMRGRGLRLRCSTCAGAGGSGCDARRELDKELGLLPEAGATREAFKRRDACAHSILHGLGLPLDPSRRAPWRFESLLRDCDLG